MNPKEYLSQARLLTNKVASLQKELIYLNELASGCSSPRFDEIVVDKTRKKEAPFIKYIDKIFNMEKKIEEQINVLIALKEEINGAISEIDDPILEILLRERYINCLTWEDIAADLSYSLVYVYKLHQKALTLVKVPKEYS